MKYYSINNTKIDRKRRCVKGSCIVCYFHTQNYDLLMLMLLTYVVNHLQLNVYAFQSLS